MGRVVVFFLLALSLRAGQPLPAAINHHPFSINHFNPAMEGTGERLRLSLTEVTYYEKNRFLVEGHEYETHLDFEITALHLFYRKRVGTYYVSVHSALAASHSGFMDAGVVGLHDMLGMDGGSYREKKEAPRNKFNYTVARDGEVWLSNDPQVLLGLEAFVSRELAPGWIGRAGVRPPLQEGKMLARQKDPEYALTVQRTLPWGAADLSLIRLAEDDSDLERRTYRLTGNLYAEIGRLFFQVNYASSAYASDVKSLDAYGATFTVGVRWGRWYLAMLEDFSRYNSPDGALVIGGEF